MFDPPNITKYYITPKYAVALIPKSGCSTMARCIIESFQPQEKLLLEKRSGYGPNKDMWQSFAKKDMFPQNLIPMRKTLALIREPISRFISAMRQFNLVDTELVLNHLLNKIPLKLPNKSKVINLNLNEHFLPQIKWVHSDTKLYKFPEHLNEAATEIGLLFPLPKLNQSIGNKPNLTETQIELVRKYYIEDVVLYNSIIIPGIVTGKLAYDYTPIGEVYKAYYPPDSPLDNYPFYHPKKFKYIENSVTC